MRISDWSSDGCSSDLGGGLRDQGDAAGATALGETAHPFGAGAGLAAAATGQDQPAPPATRRRQLLGPRPEPPVAQQGRQDRKGVVRGKSVSVRLTLCVRLILNNKKLTQLESPP